jgi:hypothetical protein
VSVLRALAGHFLVLEREAPASHGTGGWSGPAPRPHEPLAPAAQGPRAPTAAALLCPPRDALPAGGALALTLAHRDGVGAALVGAWGGPAELPGEVGGPALPAARRLAARLVARGHEARAAGRLVIVRLPAGERDAAAAWQRVEAAVPDAPSVLVLAGPRGEALDGLVARRELVVVAVPAQADPALARLAPASVAGLGAPVVVVELPRTMGAALAAAGLRVPGPLRRALGVALGGG